MDLFLAIMSGLGTLGGMTFLGVIYFNNRSISERLTIVETKMDIIRNGCDSGEIEPLIKTVTETKKKLERIEVGQSNMSGQLKVILEIMGGNAKEK